MLEKEVRLKCGQFSLQLMLWALAFVWSVPVQLYGKGKVTITPYVAEGSTVAVVVCPGGSYCWLDMETEGTGVAQWLQSNGISAFVLRYRVAGWWAWATHYRCLFRGHQYPDMLHDGEAALRWG